MQNDNGIVNPCTSCVMLEDVCMTVFPIKTATLGITAANNIIGVVLLASLTIVNHSAMVVDATSFISIFFAFISFRSCAIVC